MNATAIVQNETQKEAPTESANPEMINQDQFDAPEWLTNAMNAQAIASGLKQHSPEFASGQFTFISSEIHRLRLRDGETFWSGICHLTFSDAVHSEPRTESLFCMLIPEGQPEPAAPTETVPFGAENWRCYLPELRLELSMRPQGAKLDALADLTDPDTARRLLETSIQASGNPAYRNLHIESCQPQIMRYKPGSRCTILYHLDYSSTLAAENGWPNVVVAKTHHGDKGKIAYEGMVALWQSPLRASGTVAIAEPLAYFPESRVLVQGPIHEEMTLKELIQNVLAAHDADKAAQRALLHGYLRKTAAGLAELHRCGAYCGDVVTWDDELTEVFESRDTLDTVLPNLTIFTDDLIGRLQKAARRFPADALVPTHRSFRPAQVLLHQGDIGFIDFDGFCQAEPAMDLALFMTTVKNMARIKQKGDSDVNAQADPATISPAQIERLHLAEEICEFFLTEYEKHATASRTRIALWESLQLLSLLLGSWKKLKLDRLAYCQFMLERHLERHELA
ncbi:MAG: phosphotransferase [Caldilineaceae bacterium]|nr:phosphotransferase [Caldilineaceae bacterium]